MAKIIRGPQNEIIIVPEVKKSLDDDPDFELKTEYGRKLKQKLETEQRLLG